MAKVILQEYLAQTNDICKITDAVYAIGRNIEEHMGINKEERLPTKQQNKWK